MSQKYYDQKNYKKRGYRRYKRKNVKCPNGHECTFDDISYKDYSDDE